MKRFFVIILTAGAVYIGTYVWLRTSRVERWARDRHNYVILPQSRLVLLSLSPVTYVDAHLTGMRFHIGPHH